MDTFKCHEPDCNSTEAIACFYPDNETEQPNYYYCWNHINKHGFCKGCGLFWSGCEQFDFARFWGNYEGFCPNCSDSLKDDLDTDENEDWELEDFYDLP